MNTRESGEQTEVIMKPVRTVSLIVLTACLLTACVTQTTGGFAGQASRDQILQDYIQLAAGYYEADNMVRAKRNVDNALEVDPRSAEAYNVRALIHQREGEVERARETFERALELDPGNSRARNNFAAFLFNQGEFEAAYEQLEIVSQDTEYESRPMAFQNLGLAALRIERTEAAEEAFERALMLESNMYRSALELARIKFDQGRFDEAREHYNQFEVSRRFLEVSPTARSLWLGIRLERRFDNSQQVRRYGEVLREQFPDSDEYRRYQEMIDENAASSPES